MGERTISRVRAVLRAGTVAISAAVVAGALSVPATGAASASTVATATWSPTTGQIVRNHDFASGAKHWYRSSGSTMSVRRSGSVKALSLRNPSKRTRSMSVRSAVSPTTFAAGTRVKVTAQVRASKKGGRLALRVQEHATKAPARWRTSTLYRSTTKYRTVTTTITIARDGSRISVRGMNLRAKGKQRFYLRSVRVSVVEPPVAPGTWIPNSGCTAGSAGWVSSSNATLTAVPGSEPSCQVTGRSSGDLAATSRTSPPVGAAGTAVHVASQLLASGVNGTVSMTLEELGTNGSVVQRFAGSPTTRDAWTWAGAKMTTQASGSRVRLVYRAEGASSGAVLKFREADVTIDPAEPTTPTPTPTTPAPTTPAPTTPAPTTPAPTTPAPTTPAPTTPAPTTPAPTTPPSTSTETCNDLNDASKRTLSFSDEFNGSSLDSSKWRVRDKDHLSFDAAYLTKDAINVSNGTMTIEGRRRSTPYTAKTGLSQRWYDTGYIDSIGKFSQKYGRWEMRAKLPTSHSMTRGVWPAFWLRGDNTAGEIDIMEAYGGASTQRWNPGGSYTTTLWEDTNLGKQKGEWYSWAHKDWATVTPGVYSQFHTYGFNWTPDCMQFTMDDKVVSSVKMSEIPWAKTAFNSTFNIRLNMQVGSSYWGMPDQEHTKDAFDYVVDSVKVYRMNP